MKTLDDKLENILQKVNDIDKKVEVQGQILEEHQRRSFAAEENIALLRDDVKPIQKHVAMMEGGLKILGLGSSILTIISLIARLTGLL